MKALSAWAVPRGNLMETSLAFVVLGAGFAGLAAARRLARRTAGVIRQNLTIAIGAMVVLVTGSLFFDLPLPLAVLGHEGGTLLVVLNGLRLLADPIRVRA